MKIKATKEEWIRKWNRACCSDAETMAREMGLEFEEPKRPPLPDRVRVIYTLTDLNSEQYASLLGPGTWSESRSLWGRDLGYLEDLQKEAAARYNAVTRYLVSNTTPELEKRALRYALDAERDKLGS